MGVAMGIRLTLIPFALGLIVLAGSWSTAARDAGRAAAIPDGIWEIRYPCDKAMGVYAERCAQGNRDDFKLSIAHIGHKICGSYEITAQMGNHVDDGDLEDWTFISADKKSFRISFRVTGNTGQAVATIKGDKLVWRLLNKQPKDEGEALTWSFSPPDFSILTRQKHDRVGQTTSCRM